MRRSRSTRYFPDVVMGGLERTGLRERGGRDSLLLFAFRSRRGLCGSVECVCAGPGIWVVGRGRDIGTLEAGRESGEGTESQRPVNPKKKGAMNPPAPKTSKFAAAEVQEVHTTLSIQRPTSRLGSGSAFLLCQFALASSTSKRRLGIGGNFRGRGVGHLSIGICLPRSPSHLLGIPTSPMLILLPRSRLISSSLARVARMLCGHSWDPLDLRMLFATLSSKFEGGDGPSKRGSRSPCSREGHRESTRRKIDIRHASSGMRIQTTYFVQQPCLDSVHSQSTSSRSSSSLELAQLSVLALVAALVSSTSTEGKPQWE